MRSFGSDNHSGIHPAILSAIQQANTGHAPGYGNDPWSERTIKRFKAIFGEDAEVFFVFTGTAANMVSIAPLVHSYNSIICSSMAHLWIDECGGPETFTGCKLDPVECDNAKLTIKNIEPRLARLGDVHSSQPRVISITQANEYGMLYSPDEVRELCSFAHAKGLLVHMDGARLANACAALDLGLCEASRDLGVDVLSFGGTKNGLMCGEAVLFFTPQAKTSAPFFRKKMAQLASKMRFIAAQFEAYLQDDLWLHNARHANQMARMLVESIERIQGISISRPVQSNMIFAYFEEHLLRPLQEMFGFYLIDAKAREARLVMSFDTTAEDVTSFLSSAKSAERPP